MKKRILSCLMVAVSLVLLFGGPLSGLLAQAAAGGTVVLPVASGAKTAVKDGATIDYSNAQDGYVMAKWSGGAGPKLKVLVVGASGTAYQYNLRTDGQYETFPLVEGSGTYTVSVNKQVVGTKYQPLASVKVTAQLTSEFAPFVRPNQYVYYDANSAAVKTAADIIAAAGVTDNLEKVGVVYNYVVNNLTYDTAKAATVEKGYVPNVDAVLASKTGICFDYASLMAAMLRSQGVPVKLVIGWVAGNPPVYHAWLNVWSDKAGSWVNGAVVFDGKTWKLMDPTFASSGKQSSTIMQFIGNGTNYQEQYIH